MRSYLMPMHRLSEGEQARIRIALSLRNGAQVIDGFGDYLDVQAARMAAIAVCRTLAQLQQEKRSATRVVLARHHLGRACSIHAA